MIGMPDERYGERVCAVIVPDGIEAPSLESLVRHCLDAGLARFKAPAQCIVLAEMPMTASGKVRKRQLRTDLLSRR